MEQKYEYSCISLFNRVFKRPTPYEIRSRLPGVYASLSEDAKQSNIPTSIEDGAMKKVYTSFVEATFEQLLISDKVGWLECWFRE